MLSTDQVYRVRAKLRKHTLIGLVIGCCTIQGASGKETSLSQARAALYQAETASILQNHGWKVTLNRPGKLVADQSYNPKVGFFGPGAYSIQQARLTIEFTPKSSSDTRCHALIVGYGHRREVREDKLGFKTYSSTLAGPFPLDSPENSKEIRDIMGEAKKQLTSKHPEFAAR